MVEFHKGFDGEEKLGTSKRASKEASKEVSKEGKEKDLSLSKYVDGVKDVLKDVSKRSKEEGLSLSKYTDGVVGGKPISDPEKAQSFYDDLLGFVRETLDMVLEGKESSLDAEKILKRMDILTEDCLNTVTPSALVYLVFQNDECKENYIYTHSVNVCLLSACLAVGLHYSKERLNELVTAALFHDIGMMKVPIYEWNIDSPLSPGAFEKVSQHPSYGAEILRVLKGMPEVVSVIVGQHQEKIDGTGYPQGLKKEEINYMARLVSIVNRYEAETHDRLWRKKTLPDAAVQDILDEEGTAYDQHFLKAILKHISIFPVGSWVRISSGEIGNVTKVNEDTPMRPVINVVFSRDRKKLEDARTLDLSKQLLIHVECCVDPSGMEGL